MSPVPPVLTGTRIVITAQRRAEELGAALVRRGAAVVHAPTLGVGSTVDEAGLLEHSAALVADPPDIVVVTTGIGFRSWMDVAETGGLAEQVVAALARCRLIARGPKARGALQAVGLVADWVAESETSAEIAEFLLAEGVRGTRIAVQHHGAGDDALDRSLSEGGALVTGLEVYRWGPMPDPAAVRASVEQVALGGIDAVLFTSAPGALAWLGVVDELGVRPRVESLARDGRLLLAAVGPVTAEPLGTAGLPTVQPERSRMGALVRLVIMQLGDQHDGIPTVAGDLRLHAAAATLDHRVLPLSPSGLAVLRRLAHEPGEVVSRAALLQMLPGASDDAHAVEVAVARLRDNAGRKDLVRTVVKRGYTLGLPL
ncbi:uroporphyrinogen-III synthase [Nocardioidaceae bacterium]|nr:uroporphyrinogen-III synthase [Nocardioidaceae bacterium]